MWYGGLAKGTLTKRTENCQFSLLEKTWLLQRIGQDILGAFCWARKGKTKTCLDLLEVLQLPTAWAALLSE